MKEQNTATISLEEGYELTKQYVEYFWYTNKFYSLKRAYELEDILHDIYLKFMTKNFFEKYNPAITSKKYHVMNGVKTSMIDMLRKYRETKSLDEPNEDGLTLGDLLSDGVDVQREVSGQVEHDRILSLLPDTTASKLVGNSPLMGKVNISMRVIAIHLENGFSVKEIAQMYVNEKSGKPVTEGRVHQLIKEMREYILDNVPLY